MNRHKSRIHDGARGPTPVLEAMAREDVWGQAAGDVEVWRGVEFRDMHLCTLTTFEYEALEKFLEAMTTGDPDSQPTVDLAWDLCEAFQEGP